MTGLAKGLAGAAMPPCGSPGRKAISSAAVANLLAGRWQLGARLGRGSMGEVRAAVDRETGEGVAVKLARDWTVADPELFARFEREGKVLKRLKSPHVCGFRAMGRTPEGAPYLVLERLEGETLETALAREGDLPLDEVVRVAREVLLALALAHDAGVVHRDLSPSNVFLHVGADGEPVTKVLDFGVAKADTTSVGGVATASGATIGSLAYVAPEQIGGSASVGPRADLYALGTLLFRALTGRMPFGDAQGTRLFALKREHDPPSIDEATGERWPVGVRTFLEKLLARSPSKRFASAEAALAALESIAAPRKAPEARAPRPTQDPSFSHTQTLDGPPRRRTR